MEPDRRKGGLAPRPHPIDTGNHHDRLENRVSRSTAPGEATRRVTVFSTCTVDTVGPDVATATLKLLEKLGFDAHLVRGATCCGQPAWNSGFDTEARRVARRTVKALARTEGPIVVPSGSCTTMIVHHWAELFGDDKLARTAAGVADRTEELSRFLDRHGDLGSPREPTTGSIATSVHDSCHGLRGLGLREESRRLLAATGIPVVECSTAERCCGFGGTFSVKMPAVSAAMADEKLDDMVASGVTRVVGGDLSCLMQLEGRARRRGLELEFRHLAEVLDDAVRADSSTGAETGRDEIR